jgi:hypothetical protein
MAVQAAPARTKARQAKTEGASERPVAREAARDHVDSGYVDNDGNPLVRKNPNYRFQHDFAPEEIPPGMEYQWIRHTVHGDPSDSELFDMQENGWRAVPHKRHAHRFAPTVIEASVLKDKGCIMRQGQLLVERPTALCDEARRQQKRDADAAIQGQFQRFAVPLPDNVRAMGLSGRPGVARQTDDVGSVRPEFQPKHELAID